MSHPMLGERSAFARAAWIFVLYLIGVILFGAWVRITHSGAGCGSHWPTCEGEIIPMAFSAEKAIEYTHRLTSGLCGIFGVILVGWARLKFGASRVFYGALVTLFFIILEGAIGAGLVLKELVADDSSTARAVIISLHLVNTLMLTGAASLTAWWAGGHEHVSPRRVPRVSALVAPALALLVLTCISGAITALGDTLFPIPPTLDGGLLAHVSQELSATNHFLVRLRVWHPIVAVLASAYTLWLAGRFASADSPHGPAARGWAVALATALVAQLVLGVLNVAMAAPGALQLAHLFTAQIIWIAATLTGASACEHHGR